MNGSSKQNIRDISNEKVKDNIGKNENIMKQTTSKVKMKKEKDSKLKHNKTHNATFNSSSPLSQRSSENLDSTDNQLLLTDQNKEKKKIGKQNINNKTNSRPQKKQYEPLEMV